MPYIISWHTHNHIMLVQLIGDVSEDDLTTMTNETFKMVEQSDNRVHAIVDQSAVTTLPKSLKALSSSMPRNRSDNQGLTVLIVPSMNRVGKFLSSMALQLIGLEYRIVDSIEEAESLLKTIKM